MALIHWNHQADALVTPAFHSDLGPLYSLTLLIHYLFKYAEAVCRREKYNKELYWDDRSNLMTVHAEPVQSPGCSPFSSTKNTLLAVFVSNIL